MDQNERRIIDDLFGKLRQAEGQAGPRDAEAERHIADRLSAQPAAPYYMAQAIVIQEQALAAAQERIQELEREASSRPAGAGFLAGLFGGGRAEPGRAAGRPHDRAPMRSAGAAPGWGGQAGVPAAGPWGRPGGGFLGGALQTAMAVAGGMVVGSMIADLLTPEPALAAEPEPEPDAAEAEEPQVDEAPEEDWGDFGDDEF